jgi:hypothetical protein
LIVSFRSRYLQTAADCGKVKSCTLHVAVVHVASYMLQVCKPGVHAQAREVLVPTTPLLVPLLVGTSRVPA